MRSSSRRFWNTPPERTTVAVSCSAAARTQARAVASATALWKRAPATAHRDPALEVGDAARARAGARVEARAARRRPPRAGRSAPRARSPPGPRRSVSCADPAQRGGGVEQPARARRQRGRDAAPGERPRRRRQRSGSTPAARRLVRPEPRAGHAPRRADGRVAARHADRVQVGRALEAGQIADEDLAAPDRAVGAVAGAVVDRADRRAGLAVLGEARGEVRVVVLDGDELDAVGARGRAWSRGTRGAGRARRPRARPRTAARGGRSPSVKERSVS